ncbi:MAG: hypothetical protein F6J87_25805 [Spirulina sp. SIO3F2]|nr:hypothetical protein [Spirulina sp. SIO3F2]
MQTSIPPQIINLTTAPPRTKQPSICASPRSLVEDIIPHASDTLKQKVCALMLAVQSKQN